MTAYSDPKSTSDRGSNGSANEKKQKQQHHKKKMDTITSTSTTTSTKLQSPSKLLFKRHLEHLQIALHPLRSVTSGAEHPAFPRSILAFHLLTETQLDDLAHWYHQRTPGPYSLMYPAPVIVRWDRAAALEHKRRRFGRFIGLRGCDSPRDLDGAYAAVDGRLTLADTAAAAIAITGMEQNGPHVNDDGGTAMDVDMELQDAQTQEELEMCIERRLRKAMQREQEREVWRRKGF